MEHFTKTRLSIVLSLLVNTAAADSFGAPTTPEFLNAEFKAAPAERVTFSGVEKFTPLDELYTLEYSEEEEMAPQRRAFDLSAVAITPEGEAFVAEVSTEDMEIFEKAQEYISSAYEGLVAGDALDDDAPSVSSAESSEISSAESSESLANSETEGHFAESVLGTDERIRVHSTKSYPWRTVGRIDVGCTGTLIGPRHVLTAGHCVYNIDSDTWYHNLSFSPGQYNSVVRPYGKIPWKMAITVKGWTQSHSKSYDYAMIVLKQNIGNTTGWLGYGYKNGGWSMYVNVNGYPGDKPLGTMWHENCPMNTIWHNSRRVTHTCDTYGGMSGSGLYRYKNGSRIIYAVHAYGSGGGSTNSGTRITKGVFNNLKNWKSMY